MAEHPSTVAQRLSAVSERLKAVADHSSIELDEDHHLIPRSFPPQSHRPTLKGFARCLKRGYRRMRSLSLPELRETIPEVADRLGPNRELTNRELLDRELSNEYPSNRHPSDPDDSGSEDSKLEDPKEENRNIPYVKKGNHKQRLSLYLPPLSGRKNARMPVVIYIPYNKCSGGPEDLREIRFMLQGHEANGDYAIAVLDYRDDDLPAAVYDCKAAVRWLRAHADFYKLDPKCFIAVGKCNGGLLASILGTTAHTKAFDVGSYRTTSSEVQGVMA